MRSKKNCKKKDLYTCIFMLFETNRMIVSEEKRVFLIKGIEKTEDETKRRNCIKKNSWHKKKKDTTKKKTRKPRARVKTLQKQMS